MYFTSEFADVVYLPEDNAVLLTWKKEAHLDNYRAPTTAALNLLREKNAASFIIDARNGFEDDKRDVDWGFTYLLPEMSRAGCKRVGFIMNEVNEIEDEMDMWGREFKKYFALVRATSREGVTKKLNAVRE